MSRFVDADKALRELNATMFPSGQMYSYAAGLVKEYLESAPTADVEPVRHAVRQPLSSPEAPTSLFEDFCPRCHAYLFRSDSYCPTCGAKMGTDK